MTDVQVSEEQTAGRRRVQLPRGITRLLVTYGTLLGFLALIALFGVLRPGVFLSPANLRNILEQIAILGIVSCTQTIVMVVGDFDLSVGALASLAGVVVGSLLIDGVGPEVAVLAGVAIGLAAGAINGFLVAYVRLSAFIATLATMTSFGGAALWFTNGSTVFGLPPRFLTMGQGKVGPLPIPVLVLAAVALVSWTLLALTTVGRRWYAIGGNPEAVYLSGVNVNAARFLAFVASGAGAGLAGVVLTSRLASAHPTAGHPLMLTCIAAVFLGMTMFKNGLPNIPGTIVGVLIVGVLNNGLNILQVNSYVQQIFTGLIIVLAVAASGIAKRAAR